MKNFLHAKIHRAMVTESELEYIGSITIDEDLMDAVKIQEYEKVLISSFTSGNRLETYVIKGPRGSGKICINGPASYIIRKGEMVVIMAFELTAIEIEPKMILIENENNTQYRSMSTL